ncbi:MAG: hypothetical protein ACREMY_04270 [bacterium]
MKQAAAMPHGLICWKCGASLEALTLPLRRLDVCPACNSELHVCKLCVDYDPSKAKHCREPIAEEVRDKEHANFCDYHKPRPGAWTPPDQKGRDAAKAGLDALFGGAAGAQSPDAARAKLEKLFGKK